ncbi:MAG: AMP-dependent synthetase [Bacteroidetes bacterium]|nr:MAG: AMP-dependent synthetase [Bacteroidota bacterium]
MSEQITEILIKKTTSPHFADVKPLISYLYHWEKTIPNNVYLRQPNGNLWTEYTWKQVAEQVRRMAAALKGMNLPKGSNIGLVSKNCSHWIMADLAIMMAGYVSVPFYPTLDAEKINQVVVHSGCKVLFVGKLDDWKSMKDGIPADVHKISFPEVTAEKDCNTKWNDLIAKHLPMEENYIPNVHDLFTIIYTSGTTGMPKGVMHTYYTVATPIKAAAGVLKVGANSDKYFSYLPLCHIAERAIVEAASLYSGGSVSFVETLDSFKDNLASVQPTHFLAVPRIWTKFQQGILAKMPQKKLDLFLRIPILSGIVKNKIKKGLGLSKAKVVLTGAAPMPPTLITWFQKLGITVQEAYGMTENAGCCTLMLPDNIRIGTVGNPYPHCELKISETDGEILMKAEWVMVGYYKEPEITAKTIDSNGWLHTGDMGLIDSQGCLKITGRVKDQFKTAKGEFVVPSPIESKFADNSNIEQICLVGRGLGQPLALAVLSELGMKQSQDTIKESLVTTLKQVNTNANNWEKVCKVVIVKTPWSIENGMLTPTLKIKRNVLEDVYGARLEGWENQKGSDVIWE